MQNCLLCAYFSKPPGLIIAGRAVCHNANKPDEYEWFYPVILSGLSVYGEDPPMRIARLLFD